MINAYFDLTGKFLQRSSSSDQYIFVGYNYDANSILAEPIKNRTTTSITSAWHSLHTTYKCVAVTLHIYILDNEFSQDLKTALQEKTVRINLCRPTHTIII